MLSEKSLGHPGPTRTEPKAWIQGQGPAQPAAGLHHQRSFRSFWEASLSAFHSPLLHVSSTILTYPSFTLFSLFPLFHGIWGNYCFAPGLRGI